MAKQGVLQEDARTQRKTFSALSAASCKWLGRAPRGSTCQAPPSSLSLDPFPMSAARNQRQPWPMKWVVVAILLLIVPYTIITLKYRKAGPAYEPYEDLKNRANVSRLLAAGYQRIPI